MKTVISWELGHFLVSEFFNSPRRLHSKPGFVPIGPAPSDRAHDRLLDHDSERDLKHCAFVTSVIPRDSLPPDLLLIFRQPCCFEGLRLLYNSSGYGQPERAW